MPPVSPLIASLLDSEYVEALACPPCGRESAPKVVTAPRAVIRGRGTRNRLEWLHVSLFLEDLPTSPRDTA